MSYGQSLLREHLQLAVAFPFLENHRPPWLLGLELDFYFPDLKFGIEFQGDQHFMDTRDFGSCRQQKERDYLKRQLCKAEGVLLQQFTAFDLQKTRVIAKLRWVFKCLNIRRGFHPGVKRSKHSSEWRALADKAIAYRKQLIASYDSPTSRKRGRSRALAFKRHSNPNPVHHYPISNEEKNMNKPMKTYKQLGCTDSESIEAAIEDAKMEGVASVLSIRCSKHYGVRQLNANEHGGGECGACVLEDLKQALVALQRYDMVGKYDFSIKKQADGDYFRVDDVEAILSRVRL